MATKNKKQGQMDEQNPQQNSTSAQNQAQDQDEDPWTQWETGAPPTHSATAPPQPDKASATADKSQVVSTPAPQPTTTQASQPATIRKGIYLSALIYVEADLPPAVDFIAPATAAVKKAFSTSLSGDLSGITMTLKSVDVQNNVEDTQTKANLKGESKFQF